MVHLQIQSDQAHPYNRYLSSINSGDDDDDGDGDGDGGGGGGGSGVDDID